MASISDYFTIQEEVVEDKVDWLSDRIQPFVLFQMPDGGWVEFSLGIFILSTPTKKDRYGIIEREIEAYDGLVILDQDKFTKRTAFAAGLTYEKVVTDILKSAGIKKMNLRFSGDKTLSTVKEFGVGESKLTAINSLLAEVNMVELWVDVDGYFVSYPYESPDKRAIDYHYSDQDLSVIVEGAEEELDLFDIPNSWVVTVSNPESTPLVVTKTNTSKESPTSIAARGRTIVDAREIDDIADLTTLKAYVDRIAFEASQVYGRIKFDSPIMPMHENYDVIHFVYTPLGIDGKFAEMNWTIPLEAGAQMSHELRKVVSIE